MKTYYDCKFKVGDKIASHYSNHTIIDLSVRDIGLVYIFDSGDWYYATLIDDYYKLMP